MTSTPAAARPTGAQAPEPVPAIRALPSVLFLGFRADPARAVISLVLSLMYYAASPLTAAGVAMVVAAVLEREQSIAVQGLILLSALQLLGSAGVSFAVRMELRERTSHLLDRRLIGLAGGLPRLEHHETPEYADRIEVVRQQRGLLAASMDVATQVLAGLISMLITIGILASLDPRLVVLPIFAAPAVWAANKTAALEVDFLYATAQRKRLRNHIYEVATTAPAASEVRLYQFQNTLLQRHRDIWRDLERERVRILVKSQILTTLGWAAFATGFVIALLIMVIEATNGRASIPDVVLTLTLATVVRGELRAFSQLVTVLMRCGRAAVGYRWLDDYAQSREALGMAERPLTLHDGITFENVSFTYPGSDRPVLSDVSFSLPAGSTVALVGENGAGKTTLIKLLCGFYSPTSGRILIDGHDLANLDVQSWRQGLSAAFQDFAKFEFTARESIGVGDLARIDDDAAITAALRRAAADDLQDRLRHGLETQVGPSFHEGADLSGGQWQKIALGRAMMREGPLVLIFDEPTASLDAEAEQALFERFGAGAKHAASQAGGITVLVSHRLSAVTAASLIVVVHGHSVAEIGDHATLVEAGGIYADLYRLQARGYADVGPGPT